MRDAPPRGRSGSGMGGPAAARRARLTGSPDEGRLTSCPPKRVSFRPEDRPSLPGDSEWAPRARGCASAARSRRSYRASSLDISSQLSTCLFYRPCSQTSAGLAYLGASREWRPAPALPLCLGCTPAGCALLSAPARPRFLFALRWRLLAESLLGHGDGRRQRHTHVCRGEQGHRVSPRS